MLAGLLAVCAMNATTAAQWADHPMKNVPRTKDGKVDLNAPPQRTPDGKIDLSGFWLPTNPVKHLLNLAADLPPGSVPLQPWAEAVYKERIENNGKDHPGVRCWPSGIPEKLNIPDGLKLVQTPDVMLFLHESRTIYRQVFTDGRKLPRVPEDAQPMWMGYSVGRWDGDVLVVESSGFNDQTWLDGSGHPHSDEMRLTERFRRRTLGQMDIEIVIDDPKAYTRPLRYVQPQVLMPDTDLIEYVCTENAKEIVRTR